MGTRRLAIFDPANGHQPMRTADGRFTIAFNGAIYNFRELRSELVAAGRHFRTNCDTEVLLEAWAEWGASSLGRLRGMFAFAIWDDREQKLHLARDPFGIKPLYYRQDGGRIIFASEIAALRASGLFQAEIDPHSVAQHLAWLAVPAPRTIFKGIFSLRPGEAATYASGRFEIRSAWSFRSIPDDVKPCGSRGEFIAGLRSRLEDSARAHVLADVPVGAFLSGGLDSAVIAGLMTRATGSRLRTFSIGFEETAYSEAGAAEATARHLGTEHHTRIITGAEVARDLGKFLASFDQPTGDGLNTYYASMAAREGGVTAVLSGLGGDELFGGYPSFRQVPRIASLLPWWGALPGPVRSALLVQLRKHGTRWRKLADFLDYAGSIHEVAALQRRVFSEKGRRELLGHDALAAIASDFPFHPELGALQFDIPERDPFELVSGWELRTYMADVLLRDSDVMSMRHSIELRVPFVDRPLIEWLWRQPSAFKSTPGHPKGALADAAAALLPPGMRDRPKQGFTLPMAVWMRSELKPYLEETFSRRSVERSGLFNGSGVQALWRGFLKREDASEWTRLWSLATLIDFTNRSREGTAALTPRAAPIEVSPRHPNPERKPGEAAVTMPASQPESPLLKPSRAGTLFMAPEMFVSFGGIARMLQIYLKALCELEAAKGRSVRLLALNDDALATHDTRRCGAGNLSNWYVCGGDKRRFIRQAFRMSRGCERIVCGHVAQLPVAWAARLANPRLRYSVVAHGIEVWRPFSLLEKLALRGADHVICVSDFTRREMLKHITLPPGKVVILPNAIDTGLFPIAPGRPLAGCQPVILTVSRLSYADRYKGVDDLIEAMPAVRAAEPEVELRVVGGGDDLPRLQSLARKAGLMEAGVSFLGNLDDKALAGEMRSCRLFALPSGREGFGLVYLEAMANGRPCLGARAGGVPEVVTEETGVLVEFGDVPAIAAGCIASLRRKWDEKMIMDHARRFSYEVFKNRLGTLLIT